MNRLRPFLSSILHNACPQYNSCTFANVLRHSNYSSFVRFRCAFCMLCTQNNRVRMYSTSPATSVLIFSSWSFRWRSSRHPSTCCSSSLYCVRVLVSTLSPYKILQTVWSASDFTLSCASHFYSLTSFLFVMHVVSSHALLLRVN